jgi:hypothetical protein
MAKRGVIALLAIVNLVLLLALIVTAWRPPSAYAQPTPLGQNYVMVTSEISSGLDALYILDLSQRRMHVFVPNRDVNNRRIFHMGFRDLQRDFRGGT